MTGSGLGSNETLTHRGTLTGHLNWVTHVVPHPKNPTLLVSSSRDKSMIVWKIGNDYGQVIGQPLKRFGGHSNFISDFVLSTDGGFGLSASWDKTLRLWDLNTGKTSRQFIGHNKAVLSVDFSPDNRQIVSGGADRSVKLWNTIGQCKFDFEPAHTGWVETVRFSPSPTHPWIVSSGWDNVVKVWELDTFKTSQSYKLHQGYVNTACISPDASLLGTGGRDGHVILWDLLNGAYTSTFPQESEINCLVFAPTRYWLCVASANGAIRIWDLESKRLIDEVLPEGMSKTPEKGRVPVACTSMNWSLDGSTLYAGYTDNTIRIWQVTQNQNLFF